MKKRGFTLIELLAVIAILSVILVISVPRIINEIQNKKEETYEIYKDVIIAAARNYVIDYKLEEPLTVSLSSLCNLSYIECPIINPVDDANMNGYVNIDIDKIYTYSENEATYYTYPVLTVNLDGGSTTQSFEETYLQGTSITLTDPTKENNDFINWSVSGEGSSIDGNILTIGTENTTITANWDPYYLALTVNLDGGSTTQTFSSEYASGTNIALVDPIKSGYVFTGWSVSGEGAMIISNTLTTGTSDTTITANWLAFASMYTYTGSSTLIDDGDGNWRIKFLTSGTFTSLIDMEIDAFLVGGGAGGSWTNAQISPYTGAGGGGGYTNTFSSITLTKNSNYSIVIGSGGYAGNSSTTTGGNGGTTKAFTYSVLGGQNKNGGSGAAGKHVNSGIAGYNGKDGSGTTGQHSTTCEFGQGTYGSTSCDAGITMYAGGGGNSYISGGAGGGGTSGVNGGNGLTNSGGGGAGNRNGWTIGKGGSGIVVIRSS